MDCIGGSCDFGPCRGECKYGGCIGGGCAIGPCSPEGHCSYTPCPKLGVPCGARPTPATCPTCHFGGAGTDKGGGNVGAIIGGATGGIVFFIVFLPWACKGFPMSDRKSAAKLQELGEVTLPERAGISG